MFEGGEPGSARMAALERLRKLHLVADQDHVPIITLVNKLHREGRDPFDLLDEIQQSVAPLTTLRRSERAWIRH
jgi:peptide subunit release factor RF-3